MFPEFAPPRSRSRPRRRDSPGAGGASRHQADRGRDQRRAGHRGGPLAVDPGPVGRDRRAGRGSGHLPALGRRWPSAWPRRPAALPATVAARRCSRRSRPPPARCWWSASPPTTRGADGAAHPSSDWVLQAQAARGAGRIEGGGVRRAKSGSSRSSSIPSALRLHGVGIAEITEAARRSSGLRGGGVIDQPNQRLTVHAGGAGDHAGSPRRNRGAGARGLVLRLGDLGRVVGGAGAPLRRGGRERRARSRDGGLRPARAPTPRSSPAGSRRRSHAWRPTIEAAGSRRSHPALFRPSEFIDLALRNITTSLLLGAALVAVVLLLFLADARAAAISLTAIPLSLLAAILALEYLGFGINTLTLGGLAIALGEVVDDAIIDVENIARRLRLNRARPDPPPAGRVVLEASLEVREQRGVRHLRRGAGVRAGAAADRCAGRALPARSALAYILATLASLRGGADGHPGADADPAGRRQGTGRTRRRCCGWLKRRYRGALGWSLPNAGAPVGPWRLLVCVRSGSRRCRSSARRSCRSSARGTTWCICRPCRGPRWTNRCDWDSGSTDALRADPGSARWRSGSAGPSCREDTWGTNYTEFEVACVPLSGEAAETVEDDLRAMLLAISGCELRDPRLPVASGSRRR